MPLSNEQLAELVGPNRTLKIICGVMMMGLVFFGVILCTIIDFQNLNTDLVMLVAMASGFGMVMYMMSFVMFKVLTRQTEAKSADPLSHFSVLQTAWIVRFAMIEGACFLNLIVTLLQDLSLIHISEPTRPY